MNHKLRRDFQSIPSSKTPAALDLPVSDAELEKIERAAPERAAEIEKLNARNEVQAETARARSAENEKLSAKIAEHEKSLAARGSEADLRRVSGPIPLSARNAPSRRASPATKESA